MCWGEGGLARTPPPMVVNPEGFGCSFFIPGGFQMVSFTAGTLLDSCW